MKFQRNHIFQVLIDIIAINLAWIFTLILRFDGKIPHTYIKYWWIIALTVTIIRIGYFLLYKLYQSLWSYSSVPEFFLVVKAVTVSTILILLVALSAQKLGWSPFPVPKAIIIIDWMLNVLVLEGLRFAIRFRREWSVSKANSQNRIKKRLLIIGAGEAGSMIIKEIFKELSANYLPVGFIDDDPFKQRHHLHGISILGNRQDIPRVIKQYEIEEVIIALPTASKKDIREILEICQQEAVHILIMPAVTEIINGTVSFKQLRDVAIEDLLGREPVTVDLAGIAGYLTGEKVLITGAGGSIGAELCRQVAQFHPNVLLLMGRGENSIYEIDQELTVSFPNLPKVPIIADVRDRERLQWVFKTYHPTVVFHAAAHKHVPLMEVSPDEAVKNNIFGTKNLAELADQFNCKRFVFISTDKAVNPTSVMGATKRVAELIIQDLNTHSKTKFMAVRFGNVLGSRGSVIPLFRKQIARGGPVTVTHPEMTRFFMTIPEAAQLVIQAGALGQGGEVFILDMGEPVEIVKLARELIRLSGFTPDKDIKIEFRGVRPGEKITEELLTTEEGLKTTKHKRIFVTLVQGIDNKMLAERLTVLALHSNENPNIILEQLQKIAPEYHPWKLEEQGESQKTSSQI